MHIINANLQQSVSYQYERQQTSVIASVAQASEQQDDQQSLPTPNERANSRAFSHPAQAYAYGQPEHAVAKGDSPEQKASEALAHANQLQLRLAVLMLERLSGRSVDLSEPLDPDPITTITKSSDPAQLSDSDLNLNLVHVSESESLSYQSSGLVTTADGREINFSYKMQLSRQFSSFSLSALNAKQDDPLLLLKSEPEPFAAKTPPRELPQTSPGSGYLVVDKDQDGEYSGEEELLGGSNGDGFAALAELDEDGNGFVDEGDSQFFTIYLYEPGKPLSSLLQAGIGALSLSAQETPFHLQGGVQANGSPQARMVASSFALLENGGVAGLHQVDLFG